MNPSRRAMELGEQLIKKPQIPVGIDGKMHRKAAKNALMMYQEDERVHGPARPYTPLTTSLDSLLQWAPAVATNTALGQVAMAAQSMRVLAGGRRFHEFEQTFDVEDEIRWRTQAKPILYSSVEQKAAALRMLAPTKRETQVARAMEEMVDRLKDKHGDDYGAFARAYDALGEVEMKRLAEEKVDQRLMDYANDFAMVRTKNKTTREGIAKFVLKGEYPPVPTAPDNLSKLARYHAQTPMYRPVDGAKFDAKFQELVRG